MQRRLAGNAALSGSFSISEERPFEPDLDFKAHLSLITNACCWLIPAFLLVFFGRPSGEPSHWLGWLWRCTRALLIACLSFTISVLARYGLRENQVSLWGDHSCDCLCHEWESAELELMLYPS